MTPKRIRDAEDLVEDCHRTFIDSLGASKGEALFDEVSKNLNAYAGDERPMVKRLVSAIRLLSSEKRAHEDLSEKIENVEHRLVADFQRRFRSLSGKMECSVEARITPAEEKIQKLGVTVSKLDAGASLLESATNHLAKRMANAESYLDPLTRDVSSLRKELKTQLDAFDSSATTNAATVNRLQGSITSERLKVQEEISNIRVATEDLISGQSTAGLRIDQLERRLSLVELCDGKIESRIVRLEQGLERIETQVSDILGKVNSTANRVSRIALGVSGFLVNGNGNDGAFVLNHADSSLASKEDGNVNSIHSFTKLIEERNEIPQQLPHTPLSQQKTQDTVTTEELPFDKVFQEEKFSIFSKDEDISDKAVYESLMKGFEEADPDRTGSISYRSFISLVTESISLEEEELAHLISHIDKDKSGRISKEAFRAFLAA
eukprot:g5484.t1